MLHRYLPGDIRDRIQTMIEETETSVSLYAVREKTILIKLLYVVFVVTL